MPLFDTANRLTADPCALALRNQGNSAVAAYTLTSLRHTEDANQVGAGQAAQPSSYPPSKAHRLALDNRNLRVWDGFGIDRHAVDQDTQLRLDAQQTNWRERVQLPHRVFHASPALGNGQPAPELEAKLINGQVTSLPIGAKGAPSPLTEKSFPVFAPGVSARAVENVAPNWSQGGAASRDIARSDEFLASLGYTYDGRAWTRPSVLMHQ